MIPHNNPIENQKHKIRKVNRKIKKLSEIELLARLFRSGQLAVEEIEPELRSDITLWLLEHRR